MSMRRPLAYAALALTVGATSLATRTAHAEPPSPELMAKLAAYADAFDKQRTHASYGAEGEMDVLDGDGKVDSKKELAVHVDANGSEPKVTVLRYLEDGKDKTADAVKDAREADEKRKKRRASGKQLKMPILAQQQPRYNFDLKERSPDGSRVLMTFVPKDPADDTVEGAAWVDPEAGTVVSAGFKLSKTSLFVSYIHVAVEFGAQTSLGPAVSKVTVEGEGGILFLRKHFRGTATLSGYSIAP
jgi:hypothetical protein